MVNANEQDSASVTVSYDSNEPHQSKPSDEQVTLRDRHGMVNDARVTCGSFSSLAVVLDHGTFSAGDAIEVDYGGVRIPAKVRRAYRQPNGKWIVVLRWGSSIG